MLSLMKILLSVSTDRSPSFFLLKSFHQDCARVRYDSIVPFFPLFEAERGLTTIPANNDHLSRFYPFYSSLLIDLFDVVS
jgi:hypothetical protein